MPDSARPYAWEARLNTLADRFHLPAESRPRLRSLLRLLIEDPLAPTAVRDPVKAIDDHLADSLVALELEEVMSARRIADLGSGAGLPALPLALALPEARFVLVESARKKCAFIERVVDECELSNVEVANARAESWREGIGCFDLVTARALASLDVVVEYAAPLLEIGGTLVAWRGRRDAEAEAAAARAASHVGLEPVTIRPVHPYPAAEHRHLHLIRKVMETPPGFPRRPGVAAKRPLGARRADFV